MTRKNEARIIRYIQPFVSIDCNRIGSLQSTEQMSVSGVTRCKEAKRTIHMQPCSIGLTKPGHSHDIVEISSVHFTSTGNHYGRFSIQSSQSFAKCLYIHYRSPWQARDVFNRLTPHPQNGQHFQNADMRGAAQHRDAWEIP